MDIASSSAAVAGSNDSIPTSDKWSGIWDTNRPSLKAALEGLGYEVVDLGIVEDRSVIHDTSI